MLFEAANVLCALCSKFNFHLSFVRCATLVKIPFSTSCRKPHYRYVYYENDYWMCSWTWRFRLLLKILLLNFNINHQTLFNN